MLQYCWTYTRARGLYLILLPPKFAGFAVIRTLQQQQCIDWMFRAPSRVSNLSLKLPKKGENIPFPFITLGMMHPFHNAVCLLRQSVCVIINPEDHFRFFLVRVCFCLWQVERDICNATIMVEDRKQFFLRLRALFVQMMVLLFSRDTFCVNIDSLVLRQISGHLSKWPDNMSI